MDKRVVAFIPVRGGSKSIYLKNIKPLAGKPLIYWTLAAAADATCVDQIYVATDSMEIENCVKGLSLSDKIQVIGRSPESATDTAPTETALLEFCRQSTANYVFFIQATSPLLQAADLNRAWKKYRTGGYDSMLSGVRQRRFIWEDNGDTGVKPVNYNPILRPRRQDFEGFLVENGAFYLNKRENMLSSGNRLSGKVGFYEMSEETYFEVDEPSDWIIIEKLLLSRQNCLGGNQAKLAAVKLIAMDVDGVLTDAGMYYSEGGEELKKFNTRDGKGIELIRNAGIKTAIITSENTKMVERRAQKLKIDYLYQGITDKGTAINKLAVEAGVSLDEIAYIGDDDNDLAALEIAGISASPSDASICAKTKAHIILSKAGGSGAVRELCDMILASRKT